MKPNSKFTGRSSEFYALVKFASAELGYSKRRSKKNPEPRLKRYERADILECANLFNLSPDLAEDVLEYLNYRAETLENDVAPLLMEKEEAEREFNRLMEEHNPECRLPMNKQKGEKRHRTYLACMTNIITENELERVNFDDNPGKLTTITDSDGRLVQTLSRRIDGAYPSLQDPQAIWEVKEYYDTTTFGSRVSGGVFETQLDGYELEDAEEVVQHDIKHYLLADDHLTWWVKGRSYLCRLMDAMHQGRVDEVIFGREVLTRWPEIVRSWT